MKFRDPNLRYWQTGLMILFPLYSMKIATNSPLTAYDIPPVLFSPSHPRDLISPLPNPPPPPSTRPLDNTYIYQSFNNNSDPFDDKFSHNSQAYYDPEEE
jgi:hypothetical protein